jgi:hypothetical protein
VKYSFKIFRALNDLLAVLQAFEMWTSLFNLESKTTSSMFIDVYVEIKASPTFYMIGATLCYRKDMLLF